MIVTNLVKPYLPRLLTVYPLKKMVPILNVKNVKKITIEKMENVKPMVLLLTVQDKHGIENNLKPFVDLVMKDITMIRMVFVKLILPLMKTVLSGINISNLVVGLVKKDFIWIKLRPLTNVLL